jgi:hypothetical protein
MQGPNGARPFQFRRHRRCRFHLKVRTTTACASCLLSYFAPVDNDLGDHRRGQQQLESRLLKQRKRLASTAGREAAVADCSPLRFRADGPTLSNIRRSGRHGGRGRNRLRLPSGTVTAIITTGTGTVVLAFRSALGLPPTAITAVDRTRTMADCNRAWLPSGTAAHRATKRPRRVPDNASLLSQA